jgi:hypothetical protein
LRATIACTSRKNWRQRYVKQSSGTVILINGNPLEDISILTKPDENHALIMKNVTIYKNMVK